MINNTIKVKKIFMFDGGHQIRVWIFVNDNCKAILKLDEQDGIKDKFNISVVKVKNLSEFS